MNNQIILKFIKGFISGGIAAVIASLALGVTVHSLSDFKGLAIILGTSFLTGGLHGLYELLNPTVAATVQSIVTTAVAKTPPQA